ncbi:MAG: lactate dehydrogenase [Chloroflexi bacterium]|nr:lactate dehydrogenase [Chloroflexota bacterium]
MPVRILLFPRIEGDLLALAQSLLPPGHELVMADPREGGPALAEQVRQADVVLWAATAVGYAGGIPTEVWDAGPGHVKFIQTLSAGYDEIDLDRARRTGIPVCSNGGANAISVAEHVIMLMLATFRRLPDLIALTRDGRWRPLPPGMRSYELHGKTVGIVGMGNIGREVARRLQGWSVTLLYHDIVRRSPTEETELGLTYLPLDDLFRQSDVITLHAPLLPETRNLVNADRLALLKPTAILVNAARGGLVDEEALLAALNEGRLLGAALDTLAQEPPPPNHPLLRHPRVLVTPHVAGPTWDSWPRRFANAFSNVVRVARGEPPLWIVPELARGA